jgi:hypothetical protein
MIELRIFAEFDGLPLILARAVHSDGTRTNKFVNSHDEALAWLKSVLRQDDTMEIHTRPWTMLREFFS